MTSDFPRIRYILPKISKANYNSLMKMLHNSLTFSISDAAAFRLHVLDHYYRFGIRSSVNAFNIPRTTIYTWKKDFENGGRRLQSLIPKSTRPANTREMRLDPKLLEFIKSMREEYGHLGKLKLKPFLDEYAKSLGVASYGATKIGKIIKRKHFFFDKTTKNKRKKKRKPLTIRIKYAPRETIPGYVEMDTISIWAVEKKYFFVTAIDIVTKFAWVKLVKNHSSSEAKLALLEFQKEYGKPLRVVQTDNGSEFLNVFDDYLQEVDIKHEFIYQQKPKVNCVVERFNRTVQEEFLERNDEYMYDKERFNQKLTNYLIWYNTKRPHYSLGQISPKEYMQRFT